MLAALFVFAVSLVICLLATVPAYIRLFEMLERMHPEEYSRLGRPTIFSRSPSKSIAVQKFIYNGSRAAYITPEVASQSRYLAFATPTVVVIMLGQVVAWLYFAIRLLA